MQTETLTDRWTDGQTQRTLCGHISDIKTERHIHILQVNDIDVIKVTGNLKKN